MKDYIKVLLIIAAAACLALSYMFFYIAFIEPKETCRMDQIIEATDKFGKQYDIDRHLLWAIMDHETGGFKKFLRDDKHRLMKQKWFVSMLTNERFDLDADNKLTYCSIGPMQVLFPTARYLGFNGTPEDFIRGGDHTNIKYGCKFLDYIRTVNGDECMWDMVAGYNSGRARTYWHEGKKYYRNQKYVDKVYFKYEMYGGKNL